MRPTGFRRFSWELSRRSVGLHPHFAKLKAIRRSGFSCKWSTYGVRSRSSMDLFIISSMSKSQSLRREVLDAIC